MPPLPQQIQARVITAEQPRGVDRWGFYQRMKEHERYGGTGYFITPEDIERRNYPKMTRLFEAIPSIRVIPAGSMIGGIPTSTHNGRCVMHTYLNGARLVLFLDQDPLSPRPGGMVRTVMRALSGPGVGDPARYPGLDNFISTNTVSAIEVYPRPLNVPPQYQHLNRDCGVILIWTK